mmetsp:Transcript_31399/g.91703  ORF Transcript_31399/g.91703 Transcript_31399/m.91703 type:complete len:371 (-) Transcript_31399:83-1195(-)
MLQALLLRHFLLPVHGGHALARVREQVRVLLAAPQEPDGHRVEVEDGRAGDDRGRGRGAAPAHDQGVQGYPRRQEGALGGGHECAALRAVSRGRADHVPQDQRARRRVASQEDQHLPRDERAVPRGDRQPLTGHPALCQRRRRQRQGLEGRRPPDLHGLLGPVPRLDAFAREEEAAHDLPADIGQGPQHVRGRGLRAPRWARRPRLHRDQVRDLLWRVEGVVADHRERPVARRSEGVRRGHVVLRGPRRELRARLRAPAQLHRPHRAQAVQARGAVAHLDQLRSLPRARGRRPDGLHSPRLCRGDARVGAVRFEGAWLRPRRDPRLPQPHQAEGEGGPPLRGAAPAVPPRPGLGGMSRAAFAPCPVANPP